MTETIKNLVPPVYRLAMKGFNALRRPSGAKAVWKANLHSEVAFWDDYFATKGGQWPETYLGRLDPNSELDPGIVAFLPPGDQPVEILDVGAGPLTMLGKKYQDRKLRIVAVDPLAAEYDKVLGKHGITPPVRTIRGEAEQLSAQFGRDAFDLVHARNCIDHSYSPETAVLEMLKVVRRDGFVLLFHGANEAERAGYEGLHQWNLSEKDGDFIISTKTSTLNFTQKYKELCKIRCVTMELVDGNPDEGYWLETFIQRNA